MNQSISSQWGAPATGWHPFKQLSYSLYLSPSCCLRSPHSVYLSSLPTPLSRWVDKRKWERAELISAGFPGERGAKSAINNIFIHPYPLCASRWALPKVTEWVGVQRHKNMDTHTVLIDNKSSWVWLIGCSLPTLADDAADLFQSFISLDATNDALWSKIAPFTLCCVPRAELDKKNIYVCGDVRHPERFFFCFFFTPAAAETHSLYNLGKF